MEIGQHISHRYNQELEDIRSKVLHMGGIVEGQTENAVTALLTRDFNMARMVNIAGDEVDVLEREIDDECVQMIARRQPAAGDLRLIFAIGKVITDLERIGDEAEKIGRYAKKLAKKKAVTGMHSELSRTSELALVLLHDALDAFARLDADQAMRNIIKSDDIFKESNILSRLLITHMMEDPRNIKAVLRISWCARALERIGNYGKNISEYVVYLVKGKDIRHSNLDAVLNDLFPNESMEIGGDDEADD